MRVVVIGGGLAGITAALALAEAGDEVTLLEARPRLGGATTSFSRDGLTVDTGQHVFLRCCVAYRELLERLGMSDHARLQDRFDVTILSPHGRSRLRRSSLPGQLQMLPALARYSFLPLLSRAAVSRAALAFGRVKVADPAADEVRLGDWLSAHGQGERARRVLWDLFVVASLNIAGDDASLALAAYVVQQALLGATGAADIGVPLLPLGELHGTAGLVALERAGVTVRVGAKVTALSEPAAPPAPAPEPPATAAPPAAPADGRASVSHRRPSKGTGESPMPFSVLVRDGDAVDADAVVLAVPHEVAARLMPEGALPREQVDGWAGLGAAPIVNVHVIYDRKVMDEPLTAAVDSPVQWVFDRTEISGFAGPGQYLAISLSAADEYVDTPVEKLREQFLPALEVLFPRAAQANVTEFFVTRERRATFRQAPGSGRLRPQAATDMPGLVLAGAWTATGWPDTMESAVRSGLAAATVLRSHRATLTDRPAPAGPGQVGARSGRVGARSDRADGPPPPVEWAGVVGGVANGSLATGNLAPTGHQRQEGSAPTGHRDQHGDDAGGFEAGAGFEADAGGAAETDVDQSGTNKQVSGFVVNGSVRDGSEKGVRS